MDWCERQGMDYVFGLAKNPRLLKEIAKELKEAEAESAKDWRDGADLQNLRYQTLEKTWSRTRRVVAKAEHLKQGSNPRFVVTSLPQHVISGGAFYMKRFTAPRRDGEPDQGTTTGAICRSDQHRDNARQSTAPVLSPQ